MKPDEKFVLDSVARFCAGDWKPGEDPPDGYLSVANHTIAIEVSTLTQHVTDDKGTRPRISDDTAAIRLANELDLEIGGTMPAGRRVMLVLRSPIADYRKSKASLAAEIQSLVGASAGQGERKVTIRGNDVEIYVDESDALEGKKIVAAVMHRSSSADILKNVTHILEDRIKVKAKKCATLKFSGPIWLALLNDYFLTEADTYRYALKSITVAHPFGKVLLVSDRGAVDVLINAG
jgi:hypothetical protein